MDAVRKLITNRKGFTLIYIALMLVVIVGMVSLAVDLGYMYVAKGQLQNAADAAALAGATQLGTTDEATNVRTQAKKFAQANKAAGEQVIITDDDILIGNYNPSNPTNPFTANGTPHNAVQVTARRDVEGADAANQGKIHTFFGGIFALVPGAAKGWSQMAAGAAATATHPPRPSAGIVLCDQWCSPTPTPLGVNVDLYFDSKYATEKLGLPWTNIVAFSDYGGTPSVDFSKNSPVMQYINGTLDSPVAATLCGKEIYTNTAATGNAMKALDDRLKLEKAVTPTGWEVIVPLVRSATGGCLSPDVQGASQIKPDEKYTVTRFAKVRITDVKGMPHPYMTVQFVQCIECSDIDAVAGIFHSQLVKNNDSVGN